MRPNDAKLRELILYFARRSEGDETFGKTKLNKLLFYADFDAYVSLGQSITCQDYVKQPRGPVPSRVNSMLTEMEQAGELFMVERQYFGRIQMRPYARREPDLNLFTGPEIALADQVLTRFWGCSASDVSEFSHDFIGWKVFEMGETIPYETALVDDGPLTEAQIAFGQALAQAC